MGLLMKEPLGPMRRISLRPRSPPTRFLAGDLRGTLALQTKKLRPLPYACLPLSLPRLFLSPPVLGVQESTSTLGRGVWRSSPRPCPERPEPLGVAPVPPPPPPPPGGPRPFFNKIKKNKIII